MRKFVITALLLSAFPLVSMGQVTEGEWTYIIENGGATITASTATGAVMIPSELGGYAVKKVGNAWPPVFGYGNTSAISVFVPSSVTSIGSFAFYGCTSLTSITIPNSVTSIGDSAFEFCSSLTSITIPNSVTSIGNRSFIYCTSLTSITIPNSVTSIGTWAFNGCTKLESVTFEPNSSVTLIEAGVFSDCTSLTSITIPNSVTSIAGGVQGGPLLGIGFANHGGSVTISSGSGGTINEDTATAMLTPITLNPTNFFTSTFLYPRAAFSGCTKLGSVTFEPNSSVTSIGGSAFTGCTGLTSMNIPNSVTSIT